MTSKQIEMSSPKQVKTANPVPIRTRHGCWTCRRRRRKCDETKPICRNCIEKSFSCKYGLQLTFHETNVVSLGPSEARTLRQRAPGIYKKLQFVDGMEDVQGDVDKPRPDRDIRPSTPPHLSRRTRRASLRRSGNDTLNTTAKISRLKDASASPSTYFSGPYENGRLDSNGTSPTANTECSSTSANPPRNDGVSRTSDDVCPTPINPALGIVMNPSTYHLTHPLPASPSVIQMPGGLIPPSAATTEEFTTWDSSSQNSISNTMIEKDLLKYFIDRVAPWLDLCHPEASYGINIPIISSTYRSLRTAILAVAAHHSSGDEYPSLATALVEATVKALGSDIYSRREEPVAARHLICLTKLLAMPMQEWRTALISVLSSLDGLSIYELLRGARGAGSWLLFRFDLATAIDAHAPLHADMRLFRSALSALSTAKTHSYDIDRLQNMLLICGQSVEVAFVQSTVARNETWIDIYTQLQAWKSDSHSQDFAKSLFTASIESFALLPSGLSTNLPVSFPIHIFTSRVSFYCSFLDNLTSILLVQSKPRQTNDRKSKSLKTAAWHAVQLCGLSISNTALWSWDPVVVSALLFAGPFLTYEGQQEELLKHLRALENMTGWILQGKLQTLTDFWRASR